MLLEELDWVNCGRVDNGRFVLVRWNFDLKQRKFSVPVSFLPSPGYRPGGKDEPGRTEGGPVESVDGLSPNKLSDGVKDLVMNWVVSTQRDGSPVILETTSPFTDTRNLDGRKKEPPVGFYESWTPRCFTWGVKEEKEGEEEEEKKRKMFFKKNYL